MVPTSCDTFVVLPNLTKNGCVIFGKNSDRPSEEVQDIVFYPAQEHESGSMVKCTYIEIEQVEKTNAVILSKPNWMWGAEMGANDKGVCIGNEAVTTKLQSQEDSDKKLLGMDLLRLGLERGNSAKEALNVIVGLLEKHGQGGPCSNDIPDFTYHNSFIICDHQEAYVLETAKELWAVEKITDGFRNISNCLSIGTNIDMMSPGLKEKAKELGFWNENEEFHFANVFSDYGTAGCSRFETGSALLSKHTSSKQFEAKSMFQVLRDEDSGICMRDGLFITTSSQVSVLSPPNTSRPSVHWFTGTPDPKLSYFKPFIFTPRVSGSRLLESNEGSPHTLYDLHAKAVKKDSKAFHILAELETKCYEEIDEFIENVATGQDLSEVNDLFNDCAETEVKFYR